MKNPEWYGVFAHIAVVVVVLRVVGGVVPLYSPGGRRLHLYDDGFLDASLPVGVDGDAVVVHPNTALPVAIGVAEEVIQPPHELPPVVAAAAPRVAARPREEGPAPEDLRRGVRRLLARRIPVVVGLGPVVRLRHGRRRNRPRLLLLRRRRRRPRLRGSGRRRWKSRRRSRRRLRRRGRRSSGGDGVAGGGGGRNRGAVGGEDVVAAAVGVGVVVVVLVVVVAVVVVRRGRHGEEWWLGNGVVMRRSGRGRGYGCDGEMRRRLHARGWWYVDFELTATGADVMEASVGSDRMQRRLARRRNAINADRTLHRSTRCVQSCTSTYHVTFVYSGASEAAHITKHSILMGLKAQPKRAVSYSPRITYVAALFFSFRITLQTCSSVDG